MMKSKPVFLGALVAGILLLGAGLAGYRILMAILGRADVAATQVCLRSVAAAIEETGESDFVEADRAPNGR